MKSFIAFIVIVFIHYNIYAQDRFVERSTDVLSVVPSMTGLCVAIVNEDREGAVQLGLSTATTLASNYLLEAVIRKDRPDGSGHHSFPSTHTAVAFDGSSFLMRRYGWKWGVPAYVVSTYVAWGRVHADKHDVWDVIGGAALGAGAALVYTRPFVKNSDITIAPASFNRDAYGVYFAMRF